MKTSGSQNGLYGGGARRQGNSVMDRQTGRARPLEHGDPRTPMAWQHRNINYHHQIRGYSDRPGMAVSPDEHLSYHSTRLEHFMGRRGLTKSLQYGAQGGRPSSSSTESSTTSSTTADHDTESQLHNNRHASRNATAAQEFGPEAAVADFGTLQTLSVRSAQSTWDGEPCPVHHVALPMQMPMSMPMPMQMPMPMPLPMQMPMPMTMPPPSMALCQRLPLPPAVLLPPMLRPRPLVMPADSPALPEPLPLHRNFIENFILPMWKDHIWPDIPRSGANLAFPDLANSTSGPNWHFSTWVYNTSGWMYMKLIMSVFICRVPDE
uniref:Uncharacterized protein n=1 Tax=Timema douglasi TaxID=61478 RepID=A0A7R8VPP9_TIMDO|nr:unnamed protein product [Timema douglasi]